MVNKKDQPHFIVRVNEVEDRGAFGLLRLFCQKNEVKMRLIFHTPSPLAAGLAQRWLGIGNVVREVFGKTDECLDVYHAAEHI